MTPGMFDNAYNPDVKSVRDIVERRQFDPDLDAKIAAARKAIAEMPDVALARLVDDMVILGADALKRAKELGI